MNMKNFPDFAHTALWMRRTLAVLIAGFGLAVLGACSDVLEVDLPAQLTDEALTDPAGAQTQVNTIITHFQNTYNDYVWEIHGREDGGEVYLCSGGTDCGHFQYNYEFRFLDFMTARSFAAGLHDKLESEWTADQVSNRARYLAIASLYEGAVFSLMGSTMCEMAVDGGSLMTPAETLGMAEDRLTRALGEIGSAGDFEMPFGIASSAQAMAYGLRAQVRWMAGDGSGALADAQQVPQGFAAYVTRDGGDPVRRNKPFYAGTFIHYGELYDVIDWWEGPANPVTGQPWPDVIPFTGYLNLGILPDGRAIRDDGIPIRTAGEHRMMGEDAAVPDTRVQHMEAEIQGVGVESFVNAKYDEEGADIPLVNWKEMVLIRAEVEGGQRAIDLVNELRAADGLPLVTYANPGDAEEIRYMIIEERRRALFLEARYFMTKLQNPDLLWFPRDVGATLRGGHQLQGGVRFLMPENEFHLNENVTIADRGTLCDPATRPVNF